MYDLQIFFMKIKIVLNRYKLIIPILFMLVLLLIRDVGSNAEIGLVLDNNIALLSIVCGCDLFYAELFDDLSDVFRKMGPKVMFSIIVKRIFAWNT